MATKANGEFVGSIVIDYVQKKGERKVLNRKKRERDGGRKKCKRA
jgi:hypothetical protein